MAFDSTRVIELVTQLYREEHADDGTDILVVPTLKEALSLVRAARFDWDWKNPRMWDRARDIARLAEGDIFFEIDVHYLVYLHVNRGLWHPLDKVMAARHVGRVFPLIDEACRHGLGWLIPARGAALIVPTPLLRLTPGRRPVFHDDTGHMSIEWPDGSGSYFLHGTPFDKPLYDRVIGHQLGIDDIAALDNVDQRAIALLYLTFEQLVVDSGAERLDTGAKGTTLYRLPLPQRIVEDRAQGYGRFDYFIHMRDASHAEREFIEWVDPKVGTQCNAELCQAHAFGISLDQWLAIQQEG